LERLSMVPTGAQKPMVTASPSTTGAPTHACLLHHTWGRARSARSWSGASTIRRTLLPSTHDLGQRHARSPPARQHGLNRLATAGRWRSPGRRRPQKEGRRLQGCVPRPNDQWGSRARWVPKEG
jgi:hypothetical protein